MFLRHGTAYAVGCQQQADPVHASYSASDKLAAATSRSRAWVLLHCDVLQRLINIPSRRRLLLRYFLPNATSNRFCVEKMSASLCDLSQDALRPACPSIVHLFVGKVCIPERLPSFPDVVQ